MNQDNTKDLYVLPSGTTLCGGEYTIVKYLGEGGFGIVYKAQQRGLDRVVCIKEYFPGGKCVRNTQTKSVHPKGVSEAFFEKHRQGVIAEAKLLTSLKHQNVVDVIAVFDENNTSYMVMSFIEGKDLSKIIEERGKLPYDEAVNYIAQITSAVEYIHGRHILHRDIKPENIRITPDSHAILIDFGIARAFEHDKMQRHTEHRTDGYAPIEQYTDNSIKGEYTDIYALGATFYTAITGKIPVEAPLRRDEKMPEPKELSPDIPDEVNRTILKAMQIRPENRHQTTREFMEDLLNVRPSTLVDESIGGKSSKWLWWVVVAAVVIIGGLALFLFLRPEKIVEVEKGKVEVHTQDFTGMNIYPMVEVKGEPSGDFHIGQYEVSRGFWKKIMGDDPSDYKPDNMSAARQDSLPVENVSFEDVQNFILRLNQQTGKRFSLPTEAQWEYAARGGNKSQGGKYATGKTHPGGIWYDKENPFRIGYSSSVNELGIYQMSGNVAEWCEDYYDDSREYRVVKGGSFDSTDAEEVSISYRDYDNVEREYIGFRLIINK